MTTEDLIEALRRYPGAKVGVSVMEPDGADAGEYIVGIDAVEPANEMNGIRLKIVAQERLWRDKTQAHCDRVEEAEEEGENPPCWCGVKNPYYEPPRGTCGGTGTLNCYCGGDLCVCHNHGEVECYGCADCDRGDDDDDQDGGWDND